MAESKAETIEKLLRAANDASGQARNMWLGFLGLLTYLLVAIAGVTHKDLLLNSPVQLPIVDVKIPLFSFFLYAPMLLLIFHLGLLIQHAMLRGKLHSLNVKLKDGRLSERSVRDSRNQLHSYVATQLIAGPERHAVLNVLMGLMAFATLSFLPVVTLLFFQIKFLPYHDVAVTHMHRATILLDLALLFVMRPFIAIPYIRQRKPGSRDDGPDWRHSPASLLISATAILPVFLFSVFIATVPHGCIWPFGDQPVDCVSLDRTTAHLWPAQVGTQRSPREALAPTAWLFEGKPDHVTSKPTSWFARNLVVTDTDLVPDKKDEHEEVRLSFRGRDLRYAVLDRSDLHLADFTGAKLQYASVSAANLSKAKFLCAATGADKSSDPIDGQHEPTWECAQLQGAHLGFAALREADLRGAELQNADLGFAQLQSADLSRAEMQGTYLGRAELQGAILVEAELQGADLDRASLQGANLDRASLQGAFLRKAQLQGASLRKAQMQGAMMEDVQMQAAILFGAQLQAAHLHGAELQGAYFNGAQLQGTNLRFAKMQGVDLTFAKIRGTNFWNARIWQTTGAYKPVLSMPTKIFLIRPLDDDEKKKLEGLITKTANEKLRNRMHQRLSFLLDAATAREWDSSTHGWWKSFSSRSWPDPFMLSDFLAELACNDLSGGYVIKGIARRTVGWVDFEKSARLTAAKLIDKETCTAAKHLSEETLVELRKIAATPEEKGQGAE